MHSEAMQFHAKAQEIIARIGDNKEQPTNEDLRFMLEYDRYMWLDRQNLLLQDQASGNWEFSGLLLPLLGEFAQQEQFVRYRAILADGGDLQALQDIFGEQSGGGQGPTVQQEILDACTDAQLVEDYNAIPGKLKKIANDLRGKASVQEKKD